MPLTADYRHKLKAIPAANPAAGRYDICAPNDPTGTVTPLAAFCTALDKIIA